MTSRPTRFVALLRGVNVGRAKRIAMADLRALVESLGYTDVRTLLNSGNVVFSARRASTAALARAIEASLAERLGVESRTTVLSAAEMAEVVAGNPFGDRAHDPKRMLVAFLRDPDGARKLEPLLAAEWGTDAIAMGERAAYLWCAGGILESRLLDAVTRALRDGTTTRNWSTVLKLHSLLDAHAAGA
jgi:uncharacterized protein (DUF1697 family)